jgi:hypothetical protein
LARIEARHDRRGARRVHLAKRNLRRLHRQVADYVRRDAGIQTLEEVDGLFRPRIVNDERRFLWHALIEKTRHLFGVVSEVLGVQGAACLELGGLGRILERAGRPERDRRDRFAHARSITKNGAFGGF